jgi:hypothetical protein
MYKFFSIDIMRQNIIILFLIFTASLPVELYSQSINTLKFALVYPKLTKQILYKNDDRFSPTDNWETFLLSNHIKYEMINDDALDELNNDVDLIIIPSLEVATENMREEIEGMFKKGKGVLITGNFAEFDESGTRVDYIFQKRILNFRIVPVPETSTISVNHTVVGNSPVSIGLMAGEKIILKRKPELFFASDPSDICRKEGYYIPVSEKFSDTLSGIVSESKLSGRLLWFGYNFDQLIGNNRDRLLKNSFDWLSSGAVAFINNLPGKYSSAGIIYKDIEKQRDLSLNYSSDNTDKINYFISPLVIEKSGDEIKNLKNIGNINVIWDDFFFSNLTSGEKEEWLSKTKSSLKKITGQDYFGVSSSGEIYDSSAYRYLTNTGYSFIFSSGYADSFSFVYDSVKSMYFFVRTSIPAADYKSALNFIVNNNGIFYINADSLNSWKSLIYQLDRKKLWFTTFSDLLDWTKKKDQLTISAHFTGTEYKINIENNGFSDVHNAGIWISVPDIKNSLYIKNPAAAGELTFDYYKKMFHLNVDLIRGGENIIFTISE